MGVARREGLEQLGGQFGVGLAFDQEEDLFARGGVPAGHPASGGLPARGPRGAPGFVPVGQGGP